MILSIDASMTTSIHLGNEYNELPNNGTVTKHSAPDLFHRCWRLQTCDLCISSHDPCAWCAVSQTCVPNFDHGTLFPILAPIRNENICPLGWQERWELRSKTFGCRCSSMTFMSVVFTGLSTTVGILLLWTIVKSWKWIFRRWKRRGKDWWRFDRIKTQLPYPLRWPRARALWQQHPDEIENTEREPLLG